MEEDLLAKPTRKTLKLQEIAKEQKLQWVMLSSLGTNPPQECFGN